MSSGFLLKQQANRNVAEPTRNWFAPGSFPERDRAALLRLGKKPVLKVGQ